MVRPPSSLGLIALLITATSALATRQDAAITNGTTVVSERFIIEAAEGSSLDEISKTLTTLDAKVIKTFKSNVFSGFSVEVAAENVDSLQALGGVQKAWPVNRIKLAPITPSQSFSDDAAAPKFDIHQFTGVDKLHKAGVLGKGAIVAVVDTGVDYNHKALGGGFGPGFKVNGGRDLVGDGIWPDGNNPKAPDDDPMDFQGHGTHVSGIIAGKSDWFIGVAPEATLRMYKVFTQAGYTDDDTLIDAFLAAYEDGADIITASIGGPSGFSDNPWAVVASRLVEEGVVVTIAAGNDGVQGPFWASNGGSAKGVIGVASMEPGMVSAKPFNATFSLSGTSNTTTLGYFPNGYPTELWNVSGMPIVPLSFNTSAEDEACDWLPEGTDLKGKIVLARMGVCGQWSQHTILAVAGAEYILLYSDGRPMELPEVYGHPRMAFVEGRVGEAIINTVKAGGAVTADFLDDGCNWGCESWVGAWNSAGGLPSEFTSWGGTFEMEVKPDVAAPGTNILSTYLNGDWTVMSGTSMATPYIAGVAALYVGRSGGRKINGRGFAKQLTDRIVSSGAALRWQSWRDEPLQEYPFWAPVPQVGTGLVNASTVLNAATAMSFDKIALNDTSNFSRYHKVDITNNGNTPISYTFTVQAAGTFNAQSEKPDYISSWRELNPYTAVPKVSLPSGSFTVAPGTTKTAQFNFAPMQDLDESLLPVYSGKILISGSNGDELSVPYMGGAFKLKEFLRRDLFAADTPRQMAGPKREDIAMFHAYDFNLSVEAQNFPKVLTQLKWGTKELRWDVFREDWREKDWQYPPVVGQKGYVGSATYSAWSHPSNWYFDEDSMDREQVYPFPEFDVPRFTPLTGGERAWWWLGKLANGSYIAPGKYRMRFAALLPFSNPQHTDNWDIWETPEITVLPYTVAGRGSAGK